MEATIHQDYIKVLKDNGFNENDFDVKENDLTDWSSNGIPVVRGTYIIIKKSNNKSKKYSSGTGSTFPSDFEEDLKKGFFS